MNTSQARQLVSIHPKKIGGFVRATLPIGSIKRASAINFIKYEFRSFTGADWRYGYSIGDGVVYGHKMVKTEAGPMVEVPDLSVVIDRIDSDDSFDVDLYSGASCTSPEKSSSPVLFA